MIRLKREPLLEELLTFSQQGNGLIIGKPGIGKSYLINQLTAKLIEQEVPAITIKIDRLIEITNEEITNLLSLEEPWIPYLKTIDAPKDIRPVLIFDAFDAARDEDKRRRILSIVREAKRDLSVGWNILMSVRTYDAEKSFELAKLFKIDGNTEDDYTTARKFSIPDLSAGELFEATKDNYPLRTVLEGANEKLIEILKVPFFLTLLDSTLSTSAQDISAIKQIKSEIELLNKFWKVKVLDKPDYLSKERLVRAFSKELIARKSLSLPRTALLDLEPVEQNPFEYLLSENIMETDVDFGNRVSFSHNIFFDYLISRYAIPEKSDELEEFMKIELSRLFFLRPSFIYLFSNLWYGNSAEFWNDYWRFNSSGSNGVRLFARLTLNAIISSEYADVKQLQPLMEYLGTENKNVLIKYILQSIRFLRDTTLRIDLELYHLLSEHLSVEFLSDLGILIDRAIRSSAILQNLNVLGEISRRFFNYVFSERKKHYKEYFDRLGATMGIEFVSKTYSSDKIASRACLTAIYSLLNEPDFEILYFSTLSEEVKEIVNIDPEFVAEIYRTIFGHSELSDKTTELAPSTLMRFRSNRRQDFEMCYFRLETHFPLFLQKAPLLAIKIGLEIVALQILRKKIYPFFGSEDITVYNFEYTQGNVSYIRDELAIWSDHPYNLNEIKLVDAITSELISSIQDKAKFSQLLRTYIGACRIAYCWKRLFRLAADFPAEFREALFPLLFFKELLISPDTSFEVREFIKKVSPLLNDNEIAEFEVFVFDLREVQSNQRINAILSLLPPGRLQTEMSREFFKTTDRFEKNEPPVTFTSSSEVYTTDMWLQEKGIDLSDPTNKLLSDYSNRLERFNLAYLNHLPAYSNLKEFTQIAKTAYYLLIEKMDQVDPTLFYSVLKEVTRTFATASKIIEELPADDRNILIEVIKFSLTYYSEADKTQQNDSPLRGYSSTPRIEAAEAIPYIYSQTNDPDDLQLLKTTIADDNVIVRFNAIRNLQRILADKDFDTFWQLLEDRLKHETNGFVYSILLGNLKLREPFETTINNILTIIERQKQSLINDDTFKDSYGGTLLWFVFGHHNRTAVDILKAAISDFDFCKTVIFRMFEQMHPSHPGVDYTKDAHKYHDVIEILRHYLSSIKVILLADTSNIDFAQPEIKESFGIINEIIIRIYFQLDELTIGRNPQIKLPINEVNRRAFYFLIKPIYEGVLALSADIGGKGLMTGPSAHYFIESLNLALQYDVKFILKSVLQITNLASATRYTFDASAIREIVNLTGRLFADYRMLLQEDEPFNQLVQLLEIYIESGWIDALQLLWKLDEVFK